MLKNSPITECEFILSMYVHTYALAFGWRGPGFIIRFSKEDKMASFLKKLGYLSNEFF